MDDLTPDDRVSSDRGVSERVAALSMAIGFSRLVATKILTGGHRFSPLVAIESPHQQGCDRGSVQRPHSFSGGRLRESVAVLAVCDQDV
ncbi:MAG: hypothetical protein ACXVH1_35010, partial [Solirubrobacteraceae bacterium]